jgi:hypothetical protein
MFYIVTDKLKVDWNGIKHERLNDSKFLFYHKNATMLMKILKKEIT